jgi:plasmid maintenance system antidote protein VapI
MCRLIITLLLFIVSSSVLAADSKMGAQALLSSPLTITFILINVILTIYYSFIRFNRFAVNHGPEILTTVGIFGCFLGIALALLNFNSGDLTNSVPALLEGIKTAFWASVSGVAGALFIRGRHNFTSLPIPQSPGVPKSASLDDLVVSIMALQKGLVGEEEGTLLSQMKLLRHDSNDHLTKLRDSFNNFAKHMVENNQKAIVEALKQVIIDFNKNFTEQFGENFKQLNQGVEHLVTWQTQYKEELERIKQAQLQTASDMKIASDAFSAIVKNSEKFESIATHLKELLESMDKQQELLFIQEKALSELLIGMKNVTPEFADKLSTMLNDITSGVKHIQAETVDILKNFGSQNQSANAELKNLLTEVIKKSQEQLSEGLKENSKIIKEGVLTLDKALQKELNDSLTSLGKQLASLSEKFVEDYMPLTDKLRAVVRLAANA